VGKEEGGSLGGKGGGAMVGRGVEGRREGRLGGWEEGSKRGRGGWLGMCLVGEEKGGVGGRLVGARRQCGCGGAVGMGPREGRKRGLEGGGWVRGKGGL